MVDTLTTGINAVVTTDAVIHYRCVIDHRGNPLRGAVATVTGLCRRDMVNGFTGGDDTVMTARTGAKDLGMIHRGCRHRYPGSRRRRMTAFANIRGANVIQALATGSGTVMTETAGAGNLIMIYPVRCHGKPGRGKLIVAKLAIIRGRHMGQRLTAGINGVVTTDTIIHDTRMIHRRRQPLGGTVAVSAIVHRGYVIHGLP